MAYKLGLLLSMFFVIQVLVFSGDVSCVSMIESQLDSLAMSAGYEISLSGSITEAITAFVWKEGRAEIECIGDCHPAFGEMLTYRVFRDYDPLIISSETMQISVTRTAIIGYFK